MSLTIKDIMNAASDPSQALSNYVGNLQVGGQQAQTPAVSSGANNYQFNPGATSTPAPAQNPYSLTAPTGTMPAPQAQAPMTSAPQMQPQAAPQGLQPVAPQTMAPQAAPSAGPAQAQTPPMNMAGISAQPIANAPISPQAAQQVMNPAPAATAQPAVYTPPASQMAPTTPQGGNVYGNMLQAESNNQNFNAQGQPLTSPKGAMFAAQVMPGTATNPGYGIKPASAQTPEEYNRVGREYYNAMYNKFQGDPYKAAAAYNAGPGRVDRAITEAKEKGGDYRDYLPAETKAYLDKIQGNHAQISQTALQTKPTQQASDDMHNALHADHFIDNQNRWDVKANYAFNENAPAMVRKAAAAQSAIDLDTANKSEQAQQVIQTKMNNGEVNDLAKYLAAKPTDEGSYIKAYLLKKFGFAKAADDEMNKIRGTDGAWTQGIDDQGHRSLIKTDSNGLPVMGFDHTGAKIDPGQLGNYMSVGKGAQTEGSIGYDEHGTPYTRTVLPNGGGVLFTNAHTGETSKFAPQGYRTTPVSVQERALIGQAAQIEKRMRADNSDAARPGATPLHTEEEIQAEKARIMGGLAQTYTPSATAPAPVAPQSGQVATPQTVPQPGAGPAPTPPQVQTTPTPQIAGDWATPEANTLAQRNPTAAAIARYESAPPSATGRNSAGAAALMNDVRKINPEYNDQKYKVAQTVRNDYAKVSPTSAGGQLQAINRAIPHMDQLENAARQLDNTQSPIWNEIKNEYSKNIGGVPASNVDALRGLVTTEVQKAVAGGLGGVGEREDLKSQLSKAQTPQQFQSVIKQYQGLIATQAEGLKQNWKGNGLPEKEWTNKLVPRAREVLEANSKTNNNTRSKW